MKIQQPDHVVVENLIKLRDELSLQAFDRDGCVVDTSYALAVWKINSCLYRDAEGKLAKTA